MDISPVRLARAIELADLVGALTKRQITEEEFGRELNALSDYMRDKHSAAGLVLLVSVATMVASDLLGDLRGIQGYEGIDHLDVCLVASTLLTRSAKGLQLADDFKNWTPPEGPPQ